MLPDFFRQYFVFDDGPTERYADLLHANPKGALSHLPVVGDGSFL
jgi:hypothetical protein